MAEPLWVCPCLIRPFSGLGQRCRWPRGPRAGLECVQVLLCQLGHVAPRTGIWTRVALLWWTLPSVPVFGAVGALPTCSTAKGWGSKGLLASQGHVAFRFRGSRRDALAV